MKSIDKIIVGIDFKELTSTILSYSIWISDIFSCKIILLFHILEYNLTPPSYLMPYINKEKQKIAKVLDALADGLKKYSLKVEVEVIFGRLIESINTISKEGNVLMVLGFKSHVAIPSTSERILKGTKIPVLIVHSEEFREVVPAKIKVSNILCPVDFSENSLRALQVAKEVSNKAGAKLLIVHVIPLNKVKAIIGEDEVVNKYLDYLKNEAENEMKNLAKGYNYKIIMGIPQEEILKESKETDLIIIGSKGRSYAEAIIIGSVAETIIKNSKKTILLVP